MTRLLVSAGALIALATLNGYSCQCLKAHLPDELEKTAIMFTGKVRSGQSLENGRRTFRLSILERLDGNFKGKNVDVQTGAGDGDCGYDFVIGRSYFVVANRGDGGVFATSMCHGNKELSEARAEIKEIKRRLSEKK